MKRIMLKGRLYRSALTLEESYNHLLETIEDESKGQDFLQLSIYFDNVENTYTIDYTGHRVEYDMTIPIPCKVAITQNDIIDIINYIKQKLEAGDPIGLYEPATQYYTVDSLGCIGNIFNYRWYK